jgi:hypothetical protein
VDLTLDPAEIERLTGQTQPRRQVGAGEPPCCKWPTWCRENGCALSVLRLPQRPRKAVVIDISSRFDPHRAEKAAATAAAERRERKAANARYHAMKRKAEKLKRTPAWADHARILALYEEAQRLTASTGVEHHVDHEVPLQGKRVSGLHVHFNLRVITAAENVRKHNSFDV